MKRRGYILRRLSYAGKEKSMSKSYINIRTDDTHKGHKETSMVGKKMPLAHPCNCKHECSYGKDRAFCFPCMAKIVAEHKALKKQTAQEA